MLKYATITNEQTKGCIVGIGTDVEYYKSIGMKEMEVEQAYDGNWYVKGYAPTQPVDELKQAKLVELKAIRNKFEIEPIEYNGNFFDYDSDARDRINAAIIRLKKAGADAAIAWTCADNSDAMVTYEDLENVVSNIADRSNLLHIKYRELKELVEACETKEEIDAIRWE